jgi:serine/threonine protein kinase
MTTSGSDAPPDEGLEDAVAEAIAHVDATGALDEAWLRERFPARWRDVLDTLAVESRVGRDGVVLGHVGPYRIVRFLGRGAVGRVYDAVLEEARLGLPAGSRVAAKVVDAHLAGRRDVHDRLVREVDVGRRVRHGNVVPVHGIDEVATPDGTATVLVMALVEGESLRARLDRDGPLPWTECRRVMADVADGLAALHAVGVVHRDVKPENVLLRHDGRALVVDLGLARPAEDAHRVSRTGEFVGTLRYAAPEQFVAGSEPDARCDLYALGVTVFEAVTGRMPWEDDEGPSTPAARAVLGPLRLRDVRADAPAELADVVDRCLRTDARLRAGRAAEVRDRLRDPAPSAHPGEDPEDVPPPDVPAHVWPLLRVGLTAPRPPIWVLDLGPSSARPRLPAAIRARVEGSAPPRRVVAVTCPATYAVDALLRDVANRTSGPVRPREGVLVVEETQRLAVDAAGRLVTVIRRLHDAAWGLIVTQRGSASVLYALLRAVAPVRWIDLDTGTSPAAAVRSGSVRAPSGEDAAVLRSASSLPSPFEPRALADALGRPLFDVLRSLRRLQRDCGLVRWVGSRAALEPGAEEVLGRRA